MRPPQIVAFGGGGFSMEAGNPLLDDYVREATGAERPKVCFIPTASGDADHYIVRFYRRFAAVADTSHVSLFRRDKGAGAVEGDLEAHLLSQDLIYVGGGSVLSLLGTWRAHGVDSILKRAWRRGVLLCGLSAVHLGLVRVYLAQGDLEQARHFLGRALQLDATDSEAQKYARLLAKTK